MPPRTRHAAGVPALLLLVAGLTAAVMALPGPEPSAMPSPVLGETTVAPPPLIRTPAAAPLSSQERDHVPTWERFQVEVQDSEGRPVVGAEVRYYLETAIGFPEDEIGHTDAAGVFLSPVLTPGAYRVRIPSAGTGAEAVQEILIPSPAGCVLRYRAVPVSD